MFTIIILRCFNFPVKIKDFNFSSAMYNSFKDFFEKVLFPFETYIFMSSYDARVELWGNELYGPKLEERICVPKNDEAKIAT